jgi:hypothetical protein
MIDYNLLKQEIHEIAKSKGFWDNVNISEKFMLIISELSEALESDRTKCYFKEVLLLKKRPEYVSPEHFGVFVKDTFEDEIADTVIRILDFAGANDIPIKEYIPGEYNNVPTNVGEALYDLTKGVICLQQEFDSKEENTENLSHILTTLLAMFEGFCKSKKIDLEWHIKAKMEYNKSRPRLHGKAY